MIMQPKAKSAFHVAAVMFYVLQKRYYRKERLHVYMLYFVRRIWWIQRKVAIVSSPSKVCWVGIVGDGEYENVTDVIVIIIIIIVMFIIVMFIIVLKPCLNRQRK